MQADVANGSVCNRIVSNRMQQRLASYKNHVELYYTCMPLLYKMQVQDTLFVFYCLCGCLNLVHFSMIANKDARCLHSMRFTRIECKEGQTIQAISPAFTNYQVISSSQHLIPYMFESIPATITVPTSTSKTIEMGQSSIAKHASVMLLVMYLHRPIPIAPPIVHIAWLLK